MIKDLFNYFHTNELFNVNQVFYMAILGFRSYYHSCYFECDRTQGVRDMFLVISKALIKYGKMGFYLS